MPHFPLVSIGVPVYNSEKTVSRCLDAILAQSYPNLEIIISDNHSTDSTYDICRRYCDSAPHVKLHRQESNQGIVANFKFVFRQSTGKYFFWAAGDDRWEPTFVEELQAALARTPDAVAAHCAVVRTFSDGEEYGRISYEGDADPANLSTFRLLYLLLSSKTKIRDQKYNLFINGLLSRAALAEVLDKYSLIQGDRLLVAALALQGPFVAVPKPLMCKTIYRQRTRDLNDDFFAIRQEDRLDYLLHGMRLYYSLRSVPLRHKLLTLPVLCAVLAQEHKTRKAIYRRLRLAK